MYFMPVGSFHILDFGEWLSGLSACDQKVTGSSPGLGRTVTSPWVLEEGP